LSEPAIIYSVFCVMPLARAMSESAAVQGVGRLQVSGCMCECRSVSGLVTTEGSKECRGPRGPQVAGAPRTAITHPQLGRTLDCSSWMRRRLPGATSTTSASKIAFVLPMLVHVFTGKPHPATAHLNDHVFIAVGRGASPHRHRISHRTHSLTRTTNGDSDF